MKNINSFSEFKNELLSNEQLQNEFRNDPVKTILLFEEPVPDTWIYRLVVGALGFAILLVIIGVVILATSCKSIETPIITLFTAIVSGSVGALAGLLAPSPK